MMHGKPGTPASGLQVEVNDGLTTCCFQNGPAKVLGLYPYAFPNEEALKETQK
jgi:hypothetical protein